MSGTHDVYYPTKELRFFKRRNLELPVLQQKFNVAIHDNREIQFRGIKFNPEVGSRTEWVDIPVINEE